MNRRWLITFSVLAHTGLGAGLFVAGVWRIERLDQPRFQYVLGVPLPQGGEPEGGSSAAAPEKREEKKKKDKKIVKDAQPLPKPLEVAELRRRGSRQGLGHRGHRRPAGW
jgi:hypothetical protein